MGQVKRIYSDSLMAMQCLTNIEKELKGIPVLENECKALAAARKALTSINLKLGSE